MAFLPDEQNLQNQQPQGDGAQQGQAPITSAPAPAGGGSGAKGTINQPSSTNAAQPFTNLQTYLTANQPQIQQQGQTISNNLTNQYGQTKAAIDQAGADVGNAAKQSYTPNDTQVVNNFSADPSKVAADPNAAKSFTGMYNDKYTGPDSFEGTNQYGQVAGQIQQGQSAANQVSSPAGLASYFQGHNPNETQGMATLDSALLQGNPDVQAGITAAAKPFAGLNDYLGTAAQGVNAQITQAQADAQAAKAAATGAANKYGTDFATRVNSGYDTAAKTSKDYNDKINSLNAKLSVGNYTALTPEEQKLVGYNPADTAMFDKYSTIFPTQAAQHPLDLVSAYTPGANATMPQVSDTVSDADIANYQALQKLTGNAPALNFDMPTAATHGSSGLPGQLPSFNNSAALQQIASAYGPMYNQMLGIGPDASSSVTGGTPVIDQGIQDYMSQLNTLLGQPQPAPVPSTPQPAPGTQGDLGSGFHWDTGTGTWQPTVPLAPAPTPGSPGTTPVSGGGHHTF